MFKKLRPLQVGRFSHTHTHTHAVSWLTHILQPWKAVQAVRIILKIGLDFSLCLSLSLHSWSSSPSSLLLHLSERMLHLLILISTTFCFQCSFCSRLCKLRWEKMTQLVQKFCSPSAVLHNQRLRLKLHGVKPSPFTLCSSGRKRDCGYHGNGGTGEQPFCPHQRRDESRLQSRNQLTQLG